MQFASAPSYLRRSGRPSGVTMAVAFKTEKSTAFDETSWTSFVRGLVEAFYCAYTCKRSAGIAVVLPLLRAAVRGILFNACALPDVTPRTHDAGIVINVLRAHHAHGESLAPCIWRRTRCRGARDRAPHLVERGQCVHGAIPEI